MGFIRDLLIAALVGPGMISDAFFVAFKIPNLFRRMFAEGAFSAGFVPIFSSILEKLGKDSAQKFAEESLVFLCIVLGILIALFEIFMPIVMLGLAPGFIADPEKFELTVTLSRITFPYLLFISLVSLYGGVLNSVGRFATGAATPILLNISLIGALLGFRDFLPTTSHALAWGVAVAGVAQLIWMIYATAKAGYVLKLRLPRSSKRIRKLIRRMIPAAFGSGVAQINIAVDILIASLLPAGSISYLFFADRLTQLPLGVIGAATGTVLLPVLSREYELKDYVAASKTFNKAIKIALLFSLPATVALIVASAPIVQVLFERGKFSLDDTYNTASAVWAYAIGIPAYVMIKVLSPGFFARGDTKTPVIIGIFALLINIIFNLLLMGPMLHVGLALATTISAYFNASLLLFVVIRRGYLVPSEEVLRAIPRIIVSSLALMGFIWLAINLLSHLLNGTNIEQISSLGFIVLCSIVFYTFMCHVTGGARFSTIRKILKGNNN